MVEALLYKKEPGGDVVCNLCAHHCRIKPGLFGVCGVRKNIEGTLVALSYGHLVASNPDPVEKKPLYHFLPGTSTFSIAANGCNFKCGFCQNWEISQPQGSGNYPIPGNSHETAPEKIVAAAIASGCRSIAFTYTEPTVFYEFMRDVSILAKTSGLKTIMVTNGFMSEEATWEICRFIDAFNIDLKSFSDQFYKRHCGGLLQPVLDNIKRITLNGNWLELTTLLIPGENDAGNEIQSAAAFIADINPDIPWHLSRFFPQYRFNLYNPTPELTISDAQKIGLNAGLKFVYCGNISTDSNTSCPHCGAVIIIRQRFKILFDGGKTGRCQKCGGAIAGEWEA